MKVSIVIVNYHSAQLTIDCVRSIYEFTKDIAFEILIVDNASQDDSVRQIRSAFPGLQVIQMDMNAGYGRANNAGIKVATGEFILVLNNDTLFTENILKPLADMLDQDPSVSAACVRLYYADKTLQPSGFNFVSGGLNMIVTLPYFSNITSFLVKTLNIKKPHAVQKQGVENIGWISGAFMFVRRAAMERVGAFDPDFFLFSEEIEWCARLGKTGRIVIDHDLSMIHLGGQTIDAETKADTTNYFPYWQKKGLQLMVSNLLRVRKQYGPLLVILHTLIYFAGIPVFLFGIAYDKVNQRNLNTGYRDVLEYTKNCFRLLQQFFPILFNVKKLYKVI